MPVLPTFPLTSQQNVGKASIVPPKQEGLEFDTTENWSGGGGLDGDMEARNSEVKRSPPARLQMGQAPLVTAVESPFRLEPGLPDILFHIQILSNLGDSMGSFGGGGGWGRQGAGHCNPAFLSCPGEAALPPAATAG